jgi:hypothetical protein
MTPLKSGREQEMTSDSVSARNDDQKGDLPGMAIWLRDHFSLASVIVLIAALIPRLFLTLAADPHDLIAPDSGTYFAPAVNLLEHGAFLNGRQMPEVARTPGYPVFLLGIMVLTGKSLNYEELGTVLAVQTMILSFSVVFLYWLARRILPPVMALTGALLAALSPWGAVAAGLPLTEGLFVFLLALILLLIKLVEDATSITRALWGSVAVGLLTGAAVLVRPAWPLLLFSAGTLFYRYGPRRKGAGLVFALMLVSAATPVALWTVRNIQEANYYRLSDISGKAAWWCLASRVVAQANGSDADRWTVRQAIMEDDATWQLPFQQADDERWRRSRAVFREHPVLTASSFFRSVAEHMVHPSPDGVLKPARLNFPGDYWFLAGLWGGMVVLACVGWRETSKHVLGGDKINRSWLLTILAMCLFLTLLSGMSYGGGARFRAPLELIVPLLAGVGLVRAFRYLNKAPIAQPRKAGVGAS